MTDLHLAVSLTFAVVGVIAYYLVLYAIRQGKQDRDKQRQVKSRIDALNAKRVAAIARLEDLLSKKLSEGPPSTDGFAALVVAQKTAESVFYGWLNETGGLFFVDWQDKVQIVAITNGEFIYELPEALRRYSKRNKK
jgi:hypothetical protein